MLLLFREVSILVPLDGFSSYFVNLRIVIKGNLLASFLFVGMIRKAEDNFREEENENLSANSLAMME